MAFVRQTLDGVNGNSSTGIPVEYEHNRGVGPYIYRTVSKMDEDANGVADQNPGTAFSEIDSFRLSGERIFFHRFFLSPVWDSAIDYGPLPSGGAGPSINMLLVYNLFSAIDPQAALPQDEFPLQAYTALNLFNNGNTGGAGVGVLSVPSYWKVIMPGSLNPLSTGVAGVGTSAGSLAFDFLSAGEYKIIVFGSSADVDFNGKSVNLILSHSE